jgi:PAS domain S-box-containing protein
MTHGDRDAVMRELSESMPDAILVIDDAFRIVLSNQAAEALAGFTADELDGAAIDRLISEHKRAAHRSPMAGFLHEPRERPMGAGMELRGLRRDGSEFAAEISLRPLACSRSRSPPPRSTRPH